MNRPTTVIKSLGLTAGNDTDETLINEKDKYVNYTISAKATTMDLTVTMLDFSGATVSEFTVTEGFYIEGLNSRINKITFNDSANAYNITITKKIFASDIELEEKVIFRYL